MKPNTAHTSATHCQRRTGWPALGAALAVIVVVWGVVLPWLGERPTVRVRIERFEHKGIDPAALFYSDLPAMNRLEAGLSTKRAEHPEAFWGEGGNTQR